MKYIPGAKNWTLSWELILEIKNKGEARTIPWVGDEYRLQDKAAKLGSGSQRKE